MTTAEKKKICEQCHDEKDIDRFRKVTNQYTGVHPMSICKDCYSNNSEERERKQEAEYEARRAERLQQQVEARLAARKAAREAEELALAESNPTEVTHHA